MNVFELLTTSDIIQIIGIAAATFSSIVAIIISTISLKQNSKMIRESSRGFIIAYSEVPWTGTGDYYFAIKNLGNSAATIIDFNSDCDLSKFSDFDDYFPFYKIKGTTLAPKQEFKYYVDLSNAENISEINIKIKYKTLNKIYTEVSCINIDAISTIVYPENDTMKKIAKSLETISNSYVQKNVR